MLKLCLLVQIHAGQPVEYHIVPMPTGPVKEREAAIHEVGWYKGKWESQGDEVQQHIKDTEEECYEILRHLFPEGV